MVCQLVKDYCEEQRITWLKKRLTAIKELIAKLEKESQ